MSEAQSPYLALIHRRVSESIAVKQALLTQLDDVAAAAAMLVEAYRAGHKALVFGNGGSAADAQHIAAELVGRFYIERPSIPAVALTVNTSSLTAIGNDYTYDDVFARQLEAFGSPGDVAIGLSTSGNSANVVRAVLKAKQLGIRSIALTGSKGGKLLELADCCVRVPSDETPRIQESHITIGHVLTEIVERDLYGREGSVP